LERGRKGKEKAWPVVEFAFFSKYLLRILYKGISCQVKGGTKDGKCNWIRKSFKEMFIIVMLASVGR
jgi:hypothetical protein